MADAKPAAQPLTAEQQRRQEVERLFALIDRDKDKVISPAELVAEFTRVGIELNEDQARKLITAADSDRSKTIDVNEYDALLRRLNIDVMGHQAALGTPGDQLGAARSLRALIAQTWLNEGDFGRPGAARYISVQTPNSSKTSQPVFDADALRTLTAGGIAGAVSRTAVAPLERVKILLQTQTTHGPTAHYRGTFHALRTIYAEEGFKGLVRGNAANVVRIFPASAIQFASFTQYKRIIAWLYPQDDVEKLSPLQLLSAGSLAGATSLLFTYPLELVRARLSVTSAAQLKTGLVGTLVDIVRAGGVRGAYKGFVPSVLGIVPYVGFDFAVYESLKIWSAARKAAAGQVGEDGKISRMEKLVYGGLAGFVGQTVSFPLDTVRRRIQTNPSYKGMFDCIAKTYTREGAAAFFFGLNANILKAVPAVSISFVVFDEVMALMKRHNY